MSNYMNSPLFVKFVNFSMERNFAQEDDEYLDEYADKQSDPKEVKKAIKREKAARRHEKFSNFWRTYGDVVKLGALATAGVGTAVLGGKVLKDKLSPVFKEMGEKMQKQREAAQELKKHKEEVKQYKNNLENQLEDARHDAVINGIVNKNKKKVTYKDENGKKQKKYVMPEKIISGLDDSKISLKDKKKINKLEEKVFKNTAKWKNRSHD